MITRERCLRVSPLPKSRVKGKEQCIGTIRTALRKFWRPDKIDDESHVSDRGSYR